LKALAAAIPSCRGCSLWEHATQAVFGEGAARADLMLVGEQPGDVEDRQGKPFVGPAGRVLSGALADVGIDPASVYVTNAVKHFKFERSGKRRLHKKPSAAEVRACRPWLSAEIEVVKPRVVVCLGVTAATSVLGRSVTIRNERGALVPLPSGPAAVVTIHPSAVLRAPDDESRASELEGLRRDLLLAREGLAAA
jgi:DNA polymerase